MHIIDEYLAQFRNNANVEEYKINLLKNYYYPEINNILKCKRKNFKIGVTSNPNLIFFYNAEKPSVEIIYHIKRSQYFLRFKLGDKYVYKEIDVTMYKEINKKKQKKIMCFNICSIQ
jgi:hypothetical protein